MIRGGWAFRLAPQQDEILSSLLVRHAHAHGLNAYCFTNLFWRARMLWGRDIDRSEDREWLADLADRTGITAQRLREMTFAGYGDRMRFGKPRERADLPLILSAGVSRRTPRRHAFQFCQSCLSEDATPYYRRDWRLGFLLTCPVHGNALSDACPGCGGAVVPHLTFPGRLIQCHICGCALVAGASTAASVPDSVGRLQRALQSVFRIGYTRSPVGPWRTDEAIQGVRALLAVTATPSMEERFRSALDLPPGPHHRGLDTQFEHARWVKRLELLEVVAGLLADWPTVFGRVMKDGDVSQRAFARLSLPQALADEVTKLRPRHRKRRSWQPLIHTRAMNRLRRKDPSAYRVERADRLLGVCKVGSERSHGSDGAMISGRPGWQCDR